MAGRKSSGRSSSARSAPSRSAAPVQRASASQAAPPAAPAAAAPPQTVVHHVPSGQPGFLSGVAQMAAGHVAGRVVYDTFFKGSDAAPPANPEPAATVASPTYSQHNHESVSSMCEPYLKQFMRCMDANYNDAGSCQSYMDQLKSCRGEPSTTATPKFADGY